MIVELIKAMRGCFLPKPLKQHEDIEWIGAEEDIKNIRNDISNAYKDITTRITCMLFD